MSSGFALLVIVVTVGIVDAQCEGLTAHALDHSPPHGHTVAPRLGVVNIDLRAFWRLRYVCVVARGT